MLHFKNSKIFRKKLKHFGFKTQRYGSSPLQLTTKKMFKKTSLLYSHRRPVSGDNLQEYLTQVGILLPDESIKNRRSGMAIYVFLFFANVTTYNKE